MWRRFFESGESGPHGSPGRAGRLYRAHADQSLHQIGEALGGEAEMPTSLRAQVESPFSRPSRRGAKQCAGTPGGRRPCGRSEWRCGAIASGERSSGRSRCMPGRSRGRRPCRAGNCAAGGAVRVFVYEARTVAQRHRRRATATVHARRRSAPVPSSTYPFSSRYLRSRDSAKTRTINERVCRVRSHLVRARSVRERPRSAPPSS